MFDIKHVVVQRVPVQENTPDMDRTGPSDQ